jgi:hypothetical protein
MPIDCTLYTATALLLCRQIEPQAAVTTAITAGETRLLVRNAAMYHNHLSKQCQPTEVTKLALFYQESVACVSCQQYF